MEKKIIKLPPSKFRKSSEECEVFWKDNSEFGWVCSMILPTCSWRVFKIYFLKTIENIKEIAPFCTFCLNLQGEDFDLEEIIEKLNKLGFSYRIAFNKYDTKKGCPFNRIVDDTCMLAPRNTKMFLRVDDDFVFHRKFVFDKYSCGDQYLMAIYYMLTHPKCGVLATNRFPNDIQYKNLLGPRSCDYPQKEKLYDKKFDYRDLSEFKDFVWTASGIFLQNIKDNSKNFDLYGRTLTKDLVDKDWTYDGEDVLAASIRLGCGYYIARARFKLIEHLCQYSAKKGTIGDPRKWGHQWDSDEFGDWIKENLNKDRDRIYYSDWIVDLKVFQEYYKNTDIFTEEGCKNLSCTFEELSQLDLVEEIKKLV